jgi:hypothetical protein
MTGSPLKNSKVNRLRDRTMIEKNVSANGSRHEQHDGQQQEPRPAYPLRQG